MTEYLALNEIRRDGGTQPRAKIDLIHIKRLEEQIEEAQELEPAIVFYDGTDYWLADGFHRWEAHHNLEQEVMPCLIYQGSRRDAVLYSVGANADHKPALPRSREDKQRAVMTLLNDPEWSQWSDRSIARQCKVSDRTVNRLRQSICDNDADTKLNTTRKVRRGLQEYSIDTTKIGSVRVLQPTNNRVIVKGDSYFQGQSGTITQIPNPRQAIVELDSGERGLIQIRYLIWEETQTPVTEMLAALELSKIEANSEVEYNSFLNQDLPEVEYNSFPNQYLPAVTISRFVADEQLPPKVEVNTDDILIAFISNLDYMSEAQITAAVKAISQSHSDIIRLVLQAVAGYDRTD